MNKDVFLRRFMLNILSVIVLLFCFIMTTVALTKEMMRIDDNLYKTGKIKINLNDGQAIIDENEFLFEPGMVVNKEFFVENQSTFDVYYKIYFTEISGDLSDVIDVTIRNEDRVLYEGTVNELNQKKVKVTDDVLKVDEKRILNITFYYPEDAGNNTQNSSMSFKVGVDAVQTKNNPNKVFE